MWAQRDLEKELEKKQEEERMERRLQDKEREGRQLLKRDALPGREAARFTSKST